MLRAKDPLAPMAATSRFRGRTKAYDLRCKYVTRPAIMLLRQEGLRGRFTTGEKMQVDPRSTLTTSSKICFYIACRPGPAPLRITITRVRIAACTTTISKLPVDWPA